MAERGEGNGGCGSTGLPPVPGTPSQQSRQSAVGSQGSGMDGQTPEGNVPAAATATASKCVTECTGTCEHDKPGCRWSRLSGAGMSTRKHARNARTGTSMVWCAMDSPTSVYAADSASTCTEFCCASMPGGPRSCGFPNLGVNPMNYQETCRVARLERLWEV